jgi:cell division protease FtsH
MSEAVGPMSVGDQPHEIFLGRELSQRREVSEHTARLVDSEVKRILDSAYASAERVIAENRDLLEEIASALLERETLDADDIRMLVAGEPLPPLPELENEVPPVLDPGPVEAGSPSEDRPIEGAGGEPTPALA